MKYIKLFEDLFDGKPSNFEEYIQNVFLEDFKNMFSRSFEYMEKAGNLNFLNGENTRYIYDIEDTGTNFIIKFISDTNWYKGHKKISLPLRIYCIVEFNKDTLQSYYKGWFEVGGKIATMNNFNDRVEDAIFFMDGSRKIYSILDLVKVVDDILSYYIEHPESFEAEFNVAIQREKLKKEDPVRYFELLRDQDID